MANDFYNHGSFPTTGSAATSASMRAELDSIAAGFDKMPDITSKANQIVVVNPSSTALTSIATLPATSGGTGFASYAVGDLLFASTTTALSRLADVATGNALISGGVGVAPSYGKIGLTTHVSGTLPVANGGTGITSFGTGVATALGVNVGTAGAFVVNGGALGTPSSGTLTNATGLPVGTGISGLGTNVATALAVNVGTAGAFVVNGGALGTPSSGTVTNLTGTASININGTVGATTPAAGTFTSLTANGNTILGDASTDTVTVNGYMGVGGAANTARAVDVSSSALSGTTQDGVFSRVTGTSGATALIRGFATQPGTAAAAFTVSDVAGFVAINPSKGAGSTITNAHGVFIGDHSQGTNNYGITSTVSSGTNKWNIYASGTAANYFAGNVGISTTTPAQALEVIGAGAAFRTSKTANADSNARIYGGAYTGNLATIAVMAGTNGANSLYLGGGTSGGEPATAIVFNTGTAGAIGTGTERMRIDSSGNVGIGTSSPLAELHLQSGFQVIDTAAFSTAKFNSQGVAWSSVSAIPSIVFNAGAAERPEISWIRGGNTYPEFSIREHTTANSGGQFWAGSGTAAPSLVMSLLSGFVLIGTGASQSLKSGTVTGNLQIETANGSANATLVRNTADNTGPILGFGKSRGAAFGSRTVVASGDTLGTILFDGADGTNLLDAASITAAVDGTPGTNDMPGRLVFSTTADGASTPTERMRIDSAGKVAIGSSGDSTYSKSSVSDFSVATTGNWTTASLRSYINGINSGGMLVLAKSRGTTVGTLAETLSGDVLGVITSEGVNTSLANRIASGIYFEQDGASGAAEVPGRISFRTNNGTTFAERMRIDSSGNINIATAGARITGDFSNATLANRVMFQSSTTNGNTVLSLLPNGTSVTTALDLYSSSSDPANSSILRFTQTSTDASIRANISGTGTYLPMTFYTGGSERMRIDTSGNVGIGTASPSFPLDVQGSVAGNLVQQLFNSSAGAGAQALYLAKTSGGSGVQFGQTQSSKAGFINVLDSAPLIFLTVGSERARIDTSGNLFVGTTTDNVATAGFRVINAAGDPYLDMSRTGSASARMIGFYRNASGTLVGQITTTSTATTYTTSSDYRLKHDIQPMTGALAKVQALKPVTYKWNSDDSNGEGFIAHELAEVVPDAVTGEKDAVNEDGSIKPQGIDTSFLVATLTAAIQEQQQMIETLQAKIAALENS